MTEGIGCKYQSAPKFAAFESPQALRASVPTLFGPSGHFPLIGGIGPLSLRGAFGHCASNLHQFLFLLGAHLVDLLDVLVGEVLDVLFGLLLVVLGQLALLLGLLDVVDRVAADVADGDLLQEPRR